MYSSTHSATYISIYSYLLEWWPAVTLYGGTGLGKPRPSVVVVPPGDP